MTTPELYKPNLLRRVWETLKILTVEYWPILAAVAFTTVGFAVGFLNSDPSYQTGTRLVAGLFGSFAGFMTLFVAAFTVGMGMEVFDAVKLAWRQAGYWSPKP